MIILVAFAFIVFYFVINAKIDNAIQERIASYARAVDSVFFEKDQKIEELENIVYDLKTRVENLEDEISKKRYQ